MKLLILLFLLPFFANSQYMCEEKVFGDTTFNGKCEELYPSGALHYRTNFKSGIKHGLYEEFYKNGKLQAQAHYENWELLGESIRYYPNGTIELIIITDSIGDGTLTRYFNTGKIKTKGFYTRGFETGVWKEYDEHGRINSEIEKNNYEELLKRKKKAKEDNKNPNRKYEILIIEDWDADFTFMKDDE